MAARTTLPYQAPLSDYEARARDLLAAIESGDEDALWQVKWEHPRFRGKSIADVRVASLTLEDARAVVACAHAFDTWTDLQRFAQAVHTDPAVARFEAAADAVTDGDAGALRDTLRAHPELVHAHSSRRHHATLLHYLGANGVEHARMRTPPNAVEIATMLLAAGADANALADMYGVRCTTMSMLVSSAPPAEAGLQVPLAEVLIDHGAVVDGVGERWQSALMTALTFGYLETAEALVRRGAVVDDVVAAAGLGHAREVKRYLDTAGPEERHAALALASQLGHADTVRVLLDAGEDPDRYNPEGFHTHTTPLHHAALYNHLDVVKLLVERGARLDMLDRIYGATPLDWAIHAGSEEVAAYLRERGAPAT